MCWKEKGALSGVDGASTNGRPQWLLSLWGLLIKQRDIDSQSLGPAVIVTV